MTLNWPWMRPVTLHRCLLEPITNIWMKIDPYHQRQKCSPGIAVSSKIRFVFEGVRWPGGFKWEWGCQKWGFSLILPGISSEPPHIRPQLLLYSPIVALQWHWNRWPWMTLNDHFALKSVSGSANNELAFLAFGQNCSKIWRATYTMSATKL